MSLSAASCGLCRYGMNVRQTAATVHGDGRLLLQIHLDVLAQHEADSWQAGLTELSTTTDWT